VSIIETVNEKATIRFRPHTEKKVPYENIFKFRSKLETLEGFVWHLFFGAERDVCRFFEENFLYPVVDVLSNFVAFRERVGSGLVPRDFDIGIMAKIR
jgi:hypothetical protein